MTWFIKYYWITSTCKNESFKFKGVRARIQCSGLNVVAADVVSLLTIHSIVHWFKVADCRCTFYDVFAIEVKVILKFWFGLLWSRLFFRACKSRRQSTVLEYRNMIVRKIDMNEELMMIEQFVMKLTSDFLRFKLLLISESEFFSEVSVLPSSETSGESSCDPFSFSFSFWWLVSFSWSELDLTWLWVSGSSWNNVKTLNAQVKTFWQKVYRLPFESFPFWLELWESVLSLNQRAKLKNFLNVHRVISLQWAFFS